MREILFLALLLLPAAAFAQAAPPELLAPAHRFGSSAFRLPRGRAVFARWSPDGSLIAVGESSLSVLLAETGEILWTARLGNRTPAVAWSPDGKQLATAVRSRIQIFDGRSGEPVRQFSGGRHRLGAIAWSPDGRLLAAGNVQGGIRLFTTVGKEVARFDDGGGEVNALAFSPDANRLASGGKDGKVRVRDLKAQKTPRVLEGHEHAILSLAWSRDELRLASGDEQSQVILWDGLEFTETRRLGHDERWATSKGMRSLAFSPDGSSLAGASRSGWLTVWNCANGETRWASRRHGFVSFVGGVDWAPDGSRLVAGWGSVIQVRNAADGEVTRRLVGHRAQVTALTFSPDGVQLAAGDDDGAIRLWDAVGGKAGLTWQAHDGPIRALDWSPKGDLIASGAWDRENGLRTFRPATGEPVARRSLFEPNSFPLAFSPDGSLLASGRAPIEVWDPLTGELRVRLSVVKPAYSAIAWSPDAKRIVGSAGYERAESQVFDVATGRIHLPIKGAPDHALRIRFSVDGARLLGYANGLATQWSSKDGRELGRRELTWRSDASPSAVSPDGRWVLLSSLEIIDLESDEVILRLDREELGEVESVAWSRDGTRVAAGFGDGRILSYDLP